VIGNRRICRYRASDNDVNVADWGYLAARLGHGTPPLNLEIACAENSESGSKINAKQTE
jgi:hypothetical protein